MAENGTQKALGRGLQEILKPNQPDAILASKAITQILEALKDVPAEYHETIWKSAQELSRIQQGTNKPGTPEPKKSLWPKYWNT